MHLQEVYVLDFCSFAVQMLGFYVTAHLRHWAIYVCRYMFYHYECCAGCVMFCLFSQQGACVGQTHGHLRVHAGVLLSFDA
jgi:hypothetical protein